MGKHRVRLYPLQHQKVESHTNRSSDASDTQTKTAQVASIRERHRGRSLS